MALPVRLVRVRVLNFLSVTEVDLLLDSSRGKVVVLLILEHERELLERPVVCLGVEEEDDEELKGDPTAVDCEETPADGVDRDGVDVVGEKPGELSKDLLDANTTTASGIGPEFDEVGCGRPSQFDSAVRRRRG